MDRNTYRFQVGDIACMVVRDASEPLTQALIENIFAQNSTHAVTEWKSPYASFIKATVTNIPEPDRAQAVAEWEARLDPQEFSRNVLYLEASGRRVLIDAGEGDSNPRLPGRLLEYLRAEGVALESINTVILTHCHIDHFGGLVDENGARSFPNARIVMSRVEHDYWMREAVLAKLAPERAARLKQILALYPLELAEDGDEVEPGIRLIAAPGHTPGNLALWVESQGQRLLHVVDVFHTTLQLRAPDIVPRFDVQPEEAIRTRLALLDRAERERLLVLAFHLTFPGLGYIQRTGLKQRMWTEYHNRQDVPDYLLETYDMLACAYPNRIPDTDYWSMMALIHPYMSFRTLADVLSALIDKDSSGVYNDVLGLNSKRIPPDDIARVKQKLDACGYQEWVAQNTI